MKKVFGWGITAVCSFAVIFLVVGHADASKKAGQAGGISLLNGPKPKITWSPCYKEFGFPFECGTVQVPLDYDNQGIAAVSIALIRLPATDAAHKIGSLFVNPGGPGGSGVELVLGLGPYIYNEEVRARFDIVGFDPRGVGRSTALRCFGNTSQWYFAPFPFPMTPAEQAIWRNTDIYLANACDQRGTKLYDHMSTADVVRDLDLLRQAVGDEKLTYLGISYGTYLGMTYANMFPDKVRAIVLDSNIDPIAWSTGLPGQEQLPFSTRLRSAAGAQLTLNEFFRLCDAPGSDSSFKGNTKNRFAAMAAKLRTEPLVITTPEGVTFTFTYAQLIGTALNAMYNSFSWPALADFLVSLEGLMPAEMLGTRLYALWDAQGFITKRGFPHYYNWAEGFAAVACADSQNPQAFADWVAAAANSESEDGYFGPLWTYLSSICAAWKGSQEDHYMGPFNHWTANPVLIVNNFADPATRYEGALMAASLLPNSRLLSINGWGHGTIGMSMDGDNAVSEYLLRGILPAPGTIYDQNYVPFQGWTSSSASSYSKQIRTALTPLLVPDVVRNSVHIKQNKDQ